MNLQEVRAAAKEKLKGWCRVCPHCNGRACAGEVPGMGGVGSGASFMENVRALDGWRLNLRTLHQVAAPDPAVEFFGLPLGMPVMGAPIAGASYNLGGAISEEEMVRAFTEGCNQAGSLSWTGDGVSEALFTLGLEAVAAQGGRGVPTIKPRGVKEIIKRIRLAEDAGAAAVAIDVDGAAFKTMAEHGQAVGPTGPGQIAELAASTDLPLILKGIMTPDEATLAASLGVKGIVVSNHGGRVLECSRGTADALPGIAAAVKGRLAVIVDGGIRSGSDVLKALALGADYVLVGRPLVIGAAGGGAEGVRLTMQAIENALVSSMLLTGTPTPDLAGQKILCRADSHCNSGR